MYFAAYVLLNPVRAKMCEMPEEHAWSSLGSEGSGAKWLDHDALLDYFASEVDLDRVLEAIRIMGAAGFEPATSRV